jgi:hypothetical protein
MPRIDPSTLADQIYAAGADRREAMAQARVAKHAAFPQAYQDHVYRASLEVLQKMDRMSAAAEAERVRRQMAERRHRQNRDMLDELLIERAIAKQPAIGRAA